VRVVGTAFSVGMNDDQVDVAVSEGRVLVDLPNGQSRMVSAGERLMFDRAKSDLHQSGLTGDDKTEMADLGVPVVLAEAPKKPVVAVAAKGPIAAPSPTPSPMPVPEPAAQPVAAVPVEAKPEPVAVAAKPDGLAGLSAEAGRMRQLEKQFPASGCNETELVRYELYLEERDDADPYAIEYVRILRARCFLKLKRRVEAENEYRRYLEEFPKGMFKDEAREYGPR